MIMIEFWRHRGTEDRFTTVWHGIFLEISLPDNLDLLINTKEYHYMLNDLLNETAKDLNMVEIWVQFLYTNIFGVAIFTSEAFAIIPT
jgi:hypothetical protein